MLDQYGRIIDYMRISLTDRCNLRCIYCMPEEGICQIPRTEVLSEDEILRVCSLASELGISRIKLTGGEPLVRRICVPLVKELKALPGIQQVTLTTNGILLKEQLPGLMEAGLDAVNISLDTLDAETFRKITRRDELKKVLEGAKHEYDFILLDCTPSLGMLTVNALAAADTTLIPVQAQYLSAKGLEQLLQTVQKVRRQINPKLKIEGILLTMTDSRTNYGQQIDNLIRGAYGSKIKVFDQTIPRSVRAAEISAVGKSIFQHDPKGKVAEAYRSLTKEVMANAEKQLKRVAERGR